MLFLNFLKVLALAFLFGFLFLSGSSYSVYESVKSRKTSEEVCLWKNGYM